MYSLMHQIITEKDLQRQVTLIELLLNHPKITVNELAEETNTTERTIFSDLQVIRSQLPDGWLIDSDQSGIRLLNQQNLLANDLWELFLKQSVSVQLIKELLFTKECSTTNFLAANGLSYETLKRHTRKVNRQLLRYGLQIKLTKYTSTMTGSENAIRLFYHRLLMPFTHNNYFFEDYSIHESHYFRFLKRLKQTPFSVETEEIFGICWFFINTIRVKANCRIEDSFFEPEDTLFSTYATELTELYELEGVYLQKDELIFAFFCFLESWNYNNQYQEPVADILQSYPFSGKIKQFVQDLADTLHLEELNETKLADNLILLLLKYHESPILIQQLNLQYHYFLEEYEQQYPQLYPFKQELLEQLKQELPVQEDEYFLRLLSFLIQQAILSVRPNKLNLYFFFQGEPSWKAFLQQELNDYFGKRVQLIPVELSQLSDITFHKNDLFVSNTPLDQVPIPIIYISTIPTKNELDQLTELTFRSYL